MVPVTHYTKSGDVHLAFQVVGDGPIDLVLIHGGISHLEYQWENPSLTRFLNRLASFSRLITDRRFGSGMRGSRLSCPQGRQWPVAAFLDHGVKPAPLWPLCPRPPQPERLQWPGSHDVSVSAATTARRPHRRLQGMA
jgi:hypothetical protein